MTLSPWVHDTLIGPGCLGAPATHQVFFNVFHYVPMVCQRYKTHRTIIVLRVPHFRIADYWLFCSTCQN